MADPKPIVNFVDALSEDEIAIMQQLVALKPRWLQALEVSGQFAIALPLVARTTIRVLDDLAEKFLAEGEAEGSPS